jgi:hypothetical protein
MYRDSTGSFSFVLAVNESTATATACAASTSRCFTSRISPTPGYRCCGPFVPSTPRRSCVTHVRTSSPLYRRSRRRHRRHRPACCLPYCPIPPSCGCLLYLLCLLCLVRSEEQEADSIRDELMCHVDPQCCRFVCPVPELGVAVRGLRHRRQRSERAESHRLAHEDRAVVSCCCLPRHVFMSRLPPRNWRQPPLHCFGIQPLLTAASSESE